MNMVGWFRNEMIYWKGKKPTALKDLLNKRLRKFKEQSAFSDSFDVALRLS